MDARNKSAIDDFVKQIRRLNQIIFITGGEKPLGEEYIGLFQPIMSAAEALQAKLYEGLKSTYGAQLSPSSAMGLFQSDKERHALKLELGRVLIAISQKSMTTLPRVMLLSRIIDKAIELNTLIDPGLGNLGKILDECHRENENIKQRIAELIESLSSYAENSLKVMDYTKDTEFEMKKHPQLKPKDVDDTLDIEINHAGHSFYFPAKKAEEDRALFQFQRLFGTGVPHQQLSELVYRQQRIDADILQNFYDNLLDKDFLEVNYDDKIALFVGNEVIARFIDQLESHTKKIILKFISEDYRQEEDVSRRPLVVEENAAETRKQYYYNQAKDQNPMDIASLEEDLKLQMAEAANIDDYIKAISEILRTYHETIYVHVDQDESVLEKGRRNLLWKEAMHKANPHIEHGQLTLFNKWQKEFKGLMDDLLVKLKDVKALTQINSPDANMDDSSDIRALLAHTRARLEAFHLLKEEIFRPTFNFPKQ